MNDFPDSVIFNDFEKSVLTDFTYFVLLGFLNVLFQVFLEFLAFDFVDLSLKVCDGVFNYFDFFALLEGVFGFLKDFFGGFFVLNDLSVDGLDLVVEGFKENFSFLVGFFELLFL